MKFLVKYSDDGRITVPREVRSALNLREKTDLALSIEGGRIIIEKPIERCTYCGSTRVTVYNLNRAGEEQKVYLCDDCKKMFEGIYESNKIL